MKTQSLFFMAITMGFSNSRNQNLAELVGKTKADWNDFDNANMQRVPYMIHVPGQEKWWCEPYVWWPS